MTLVQVERPVWDVSDQRSLAPGPTRSATRRRPSWIRRCGPDAFLLTPMISVITYVMSRGLNNSPAHFADEGTYVSQAWALMTGRGLAPYTYWYDHPPLGWIQLAGWFEVTGTLHHSSNPILAGRVFMVVANAVACALLYLVCRRLRMSRLASTGGVALYGLSPLAVDFHRMVFLDGIAVPWLLGAMALALSPKRRLSAAVGAGACMAIAVLTKETFLVMAPFVGWTLYQNFVGRTRRYVVTLSTVVFVLISSMYVLYAALRGELFSGRGHVSLQTAVAFQLFTRTSSGGVLSASSAAHALVVGWLDLDPWLLGCALAALPVALVVPRLRPLAGAYLFQILVALRPGYLPYPFVIVMLPLAAIVIACVVDRCTGQSVRFRVRAALRHAIGLGRLARARRVLVEAPALLALAVCGLVVGARIAPAWASGDAHLMEFDANRPTAEAVTWVERHVSRKVPVLVDDSVWLDLVQAGWSPTRGVVWNVKLDLDSEVQHRFPDGWREFGYFVDTNTVNATATSQPNTWAFLRHSSVAASFGSGINEVKILKILPRWSLMRHPG